jgi:transcriptional regulator
MYIPNHFRQPDVASMHALIRAHPLATLITLDSGLPCANHVPLHLSPEPTPHGLLSGHLPRANPLWQSHPREADAIAIFHGPDAYISPSWYPSKLDGGSVVPTWNYAVVHAHGRIRVLDDESWLRAHLEKLKNEHEARLAAPWRVTDAPPRYTAQLLRGLVGIEMAITRLDGKWKVSQNRSEADRAGVAAGLRETGSAGALAMANLVAADPR